MYKIDWYGNDGRCNPLPETVKTAQCGVCGTPMNVKRNVFGATSWAEAVAGKKHKHDRFTCPYLNEGWHREIYQIKTEVYKALLSGVSNRDEIRKKAAKEIRKILKKREK